MRVMHSDGSDFEKYNENTKIPVVRGRDRSLKDCCVTAICPPLMAPPGVGNTGVTCDDHEKVEHRLNYENGSIRHVRILICRIDYAPKEDLVYERAKKREEYQLQTIRQRQPQEKIYKRHYIPIQFYNRRIDLKFSLLLAE